MQLRETILLEWEKSLSDQSIEMDSLMSSQGDVDRS